MDIQNFFPTTSANRVLAYLRAIGWDKHVAKLLATLCTYKGYLPQGAPTSPRLSNLVNFEMDARLHGLAYRAKAAYTRYADDITFSFAEDKASYHYWKATTEEIEQADKELAEIERRLDK